MENRDIKEFKLKELIKNNMVCRVALAITVPTVCVGTGLLIRSLINKDGKTQSIILIDNGTISITNDKGKKLNPDVKGENYNIICFDDQNWIITVKCVDSETYANFIANNIYFTDDDKIILDTLSLTDENYVYFKENQEELTDKGHSRVKKGTI